MSIIPWEFDRAAEQPGTENLSLASGVAGRKNLQIQWLRALAAFMVVLCHATVLQSWTGEVHDTPLDIINVFFGFFPVALFFAITGYLMSIAVRVQEPFLFLSHRLTRIYPFFLIVCAIVYCLDPLLNIHLPIDLKALTLVPADTPFYLLGGIEWTLAVEICFYVALFFIALAGAGRYISWVAAAWLIYLGATSWFQSDNPLILSTILRSSHCAALAGGLLTPWLLRAKFPPALLLSLGFGGFVPLYIYMPHNVDIIRWLAAFWAVVILTGMIGLSQRNPAAGNNPAGRALARFGDYSYALYLCHLPIIRFVYSTMHGIFFPVLWILVIALCILAAIALGPIDVWLYSHLKKAINRANLPLRNSFVLAFLVLFFLLSGKILYDHHIMHQGQNFAAETAPLIAAHGSLATKADIEAAARSVGFTRSSEMHGVVDKIEWKDGALAATGWAIDTNKQANRGTYGTPFAIGFFQDGALLGSAMVAKPRQAINDLFGTKAPSAFEWKAPAACDADNPIIALVFSPKKTFAIIQELHVTCPKQN